jgi:hypothetical protein
MFIPDPEFYPSRISDPTTATKEKGEKSFFYLFFVATNITKWKIIFCLTLTGKERNLSQFTKKYVLFTQTIFTEFSKYGFGIREKPIFPLNRNTNMGLGAGIREKPIPDPVVKKALDPGSGSATLVLVLWEAYQNVGFEYLFFFSRKIHGPNKLPNRFTYL